MAREIPCSVASSDAVEWEEGRARDARYWLAEAGRQTEGPAGSQPIASTSKHTELSTPASTTQRDGASVESPPSPEQLTSSLLPSATDILRDLPSRAEYPAPVSPRCSPSPAHALEGSSPPGRKLRTRTAVQTNPFTAEQARYAGVLNRTGWQDAVLCLPRGREETDEERRERKRRQALRGKDDLQGWLVLEGEKGSRGEDGVVVDDHAESMRDEDLDFGPRERVRVAAAERQLEESRQPRHRHYADDYDRLHALQDVHTEDVARRPGSHQAEHQHAKKRRRRRSVDSDTASESLSSPRRPRNRIVDLSSSSSSEDREPVHAPSKHAVDGHMLKGKRKKALGAMMPAAFLKRAARDLELMQEEKIMYAEGSGDEEGSTDSDVVDSDGELRPGRVARRRGRGAALDLTGDAFTDESTDGVEGSSSDDADEVPVGDALSNWLGAFGPRRKRKPDNARGRDYLDRLLVQSRKGSRKPAQASKNRGKLKQSRLPFTERCNKEPVITVTNHKGAASRHHPKAVVRFDGDSLFKALAPSVSAVRAAPTISAQRTPEPWDTFGRFSHDFGIDRLPTGLTLPLDSYLGRGRLRSLVEYLCLMPSRSTSQAPLNAFGTSLDIEVSASTLLAELPTICDRIFTELEASASDVDGSQVVVDACESLWWLACYSGYQVDAQFRSELEVHLAHLRTRLASINLLSTTRVQLDWAFLELGLRMKSPPKAIEELTVSLLRTLISYNLTSVVANLREQEVGARLDVHDNEAALFADVWVRLLRIAIDAGTNATGLDVLTMWRLLEFGLESKARDTKLHPLQASEALACTAILLCALSQFSARGVVEETPSLSAHWSVILAPLAHFDSVAFTEETPKLTNTALQKRDAYVATLFARCLILVDRWKWVLDGREGVLPRLFDIINSRQLASLATDGPRDFPAFLQVFDGQVTTELDRRGDTAFHIFLKLFLHTTHHLAGDTEAEKRKTFNKLITRIVPQRKMPSTRDVISSRVSLDRSILVNHYSLFMALVLASPASATLRLGQIRNLLSFEEADDEARLICLRAVMYLGIILRHLHIDVVPILTWLAQICRYLREQYQLFEARRQPAARFGNAREIDATVKEMYSVALSLSTVLRAVHHILMVDETLASYAQEGSIYPDMALLDDAWIRELVSSPLAQDPLIGSELLKILDTFLTLRDKALAHAEKHLSQDEFGGIGTFDYDDPALCAILGYEPSANISRAKERDRQFAELAHSVLSPALFRLLTAAYSRDTSKTRAAPVANVRSNGRYVQELIACWTRCAIVTVNAGLRDWSHYVVWGDEVWKRISDPLGRRDVALHFLVHALEDSQKAYTLNKDECISIWFQVIVSRRLSLQHRLTSTILNVDREPGLLGSDGIIALPFAPDPESGAYDISLEELEHQRLRMIDAILHRAHRLILAGGAPSRTVTAHLAGMCIALRDNLESFDALDAAAKIDYLQVARTISTKMKTILGSDVTESMTALTVLNTVMDKCESANA